MNHAPAKELDESILQKSAGWKRALFGVVSVLAVALCVWLIHPVLEMGTNDDWSYVKTAQVYADTGHFVYNGWATAMLGWQIPWGALFIKLFGFSFLTLRMSTVVIAMAGACLFYLILLRFGISSENAFFGTLVLFLSPLSLPLTTSFMTDVPGIFSILVCLYCCLRVLSARDIRTALPWLYLAAGSNIVLGTVRQIVWLGVLVMVPCTIWLVRRQRALVIAGFVLWLCGAVSIFLCMRWFQHQPYSLPEKLLTGPMRLHDIAIAAFRMYCYALSLLIFTLPVLIAWLASAKKLKRTALISIGLVLALYVADVGATHGYGASWMQVPPGLGNIVSKYGINQFEAILGKQSEVLPFWLRLITGLIVIASALVAAVVIRSGVRERAFDAAKIPGWQATLILLVPFGLANCLLVLPRALGAGLFDRYLLPVMIPTIILLLRAYEQQFKRNLPTLSYVTLIVFTAFGVAGTHDAFAQSRARLEAANQVTKTGLPRAAVSGGIEYDGWTQIEMQGYLNDPRLVNPPGSYHPNPHVKDCRRTDNFFLDYIPAVEHLYFIVSSPMPCLENSAFGPMSYTTWMAPTHRVIYIQRDPQIAGK